ncbi:heterochromatin protein 1-binding protein 3 [Hyla sarda]|uniref:heterochromatin protein 1-binding protein 3 n=1 Tax=Hyla sarda TaxID=327740 RepID=UPI0024C3F117|nr:heterochromatin protein 1-binding protein 3 [Hyla sarda]XP_056399556.1 heterochromatin protein 1-binding protein 3 [Hyla sarda]XP_056399557.1 heterochromatin protein 1-binding protein 3 [Hyla sarda]
MPIRRSVNSSSQEAAPKNRPAESEDKKKEEADASSEESASTGEEQETETPPATSSETEQVKESDANEEKKADGADGEEAKKDGDKEQSKEKEKKVKKTIPAWATLSASQLARAQKQTHMSSSSRPKMDEILTEAIKACFQKTGASVVAIRKYIISKYPSLDLEKRGYLLKQSLKRALQRGNIRQIKGKGASGSFVVVSNSSKSASKSRDKKKSSTPAADQPNVKLEDILPLAFTRLCEPKEASYSLIKKYVSQYYPKLKVDVRPQMLKNALQRAVEKGQLEQITGKGASGTFQLKRAGDKPLLSGGVFEDAILSAITAMNEPKTCSTTAIKKYVLENHPGVNSSFQVHLLKRTLQKCEKNGWMEQISGKGFSGTYQLSFPYYPSPYVLFPDKAAEEEEEESDNESEEEEEEEESEEESEDEEPPPKRRMQKKAAPSKSRSRAPPPKPKKSAPAPRGKAKSAPKKAPPPPPPKAKKGKAASPPPPPAKKPASRGSKKAAPAKKAAKPAAKGKSSQRKSLRSRK